jgi:aminomethyltransferase
MGFRLYGNDIDETTNPLEAGLGWITKLDKGDFIGRDALREARRRGLSRRLLGFVISEHRAVARHGYEIRSNGISVGNVTSGSFSPTLEKNIGMGYVASAIADSGAELAVVVRGVETPTEITPIPFVEK